MHSCLLKKTLVIGIIILFFGISSVSAVNIDVKSIKLNEYIENPSPDIEKLYPTDDAFVSEAVGHGHTH